jgi:hypothetical protein
MLADEGWEESVTGTQDDETVTVTVKVLPTHAPAVGVTV